MSDLKRYIETRKAKDPAFADGFDAGYTDIKIGALLQQARETVGLTREQVALRLGTKKSAISRIENHAENVTLSTLKAYAQAVGGTLQVQLLLGSLAQ